MISDGTAAVVVLVDYYWSANVHTALMVQIRTRPKSIRSSSLKMFVEKKNKFVKAKECSEVDAKEFLNDALGRDGGDGIVVTRLPDDREVLGVIPENTQHRLKCHCINSGGSL